MIPYYSQLPDRNELIQQLNLLSRSEISPDQLIGIMLINIRRFRYINIEFNSATGDKLLESFNQRIQDIILESDRLFRIGNDEFAILFTKLANQQLIKNAALRIIERLSDTHTITSKPIAVRINIGIALNSEPNSIISKLIDHADIALSYARKNNEKYVIFDNKVASDNISRIGLITDLKTALKENLLTMAYQPQYNYSLHKITGAEALARWEHDKIGPVSPETFIALAEECGLIEDLTYWSINSAIQQWSMLQKKVTRSTVSINLSARILDFPDIFEWVNQALNMWGLPPELLILELTESSMMQNPEKSLDVLNKFSACGIRISIDDFGTGYSSLSYLKKLPVSELKIDKSFVSNMIKNKDDKSIVQSVIHLAHNFGMSVVAEGVENKETFTALSQLNCNIVQGFYIARSMPAEEYPLWFASRKME
ncbi:MAG: EAL domain-containing protein [Gammaproteobacteria bacterium]|nr:EAL domain-containing protein [Gammaproteobacteria bacterium]